MLAKRSAISLLKELVVKLNKKTRRSLSPVLDRLVNHFTCNTHRLHVELIQKFAEFVNFVNNSGKVFF